MVENNNKVQQRLIEEEMKEAYIDYAMSVIVSRALPNVCDGLKPVHRRILYAMKDMGMLHNKPFKKCARIVGEVLGKYHPHSDTAVYDSLVRMAQDFSLRYPLINGHGNFGSVDGDRAAAMRYTEARLQKMASDLLEDIDKNTVEYIDNFDASLKEPVVLPSKLPNLLINGSSGIAVGMATNIPPHNVSEALDACIAFVDNQEISINELMKYVKGPDFPTGGIILGSNGIIKAYKTGRGSIRIRSRVDVEENKLIVSEIPYQVNKTTLIEGIVNLVKEKRIEGISDIRDESDRDGMRVVIILKKNINPELLLNQLYRLSQLEVSYGMNMLALVDNQPKTLSLFDLVKEFVFHRKRIVFRRTKFDLDKAEKRAHILEGLKIALENIDEVVKIIKSSKDVEGARKLLISTFSLSLEQCQAILDMRLHRLTSLETNKIREEYIDLIRLIKDLREILADENRIFKIIKEEFLEMKKKYGDERRTELLDVEEEIEDEDLIKKENVVVTVTHDGYVNRMPVETYRQQARGGKGIRATGTKDEDFVEHIFTTSTHDYLLFFSNLGRVYWSKAYSIPSGSRYAKGMNLVNLLRLSKDEGIRTVIPVSNFDIGYLNIITKKGLIKKTALKEYSRPRKGGIVAVNLKQGDNLVDVILTKDGEELIVATASGRAIRFKDEVIRAVGRNSMGVRAIKLRNDKVIGVDIARDSLLTITENGYGKRTDIKEYNVINRGGLGVINIKTSERNGKAIGIKSVKSEEDLMLVTKKGTLIRVSAKNISKIGRNTQGVRIMKLGAGDKVISVARVF
jgi:DNA gyrase subunit A